MHQTGRGRPMNSDRLSCNWVRSGALKNPLSARSASCPGAWAYLSLTAGDHYIAIDYSPQMTSLLIDKLGGSLPDNFRLLMSDIRKGIPLPDESMDVVIEVQTLMITPWLAREYARIL